LRLLRIEIPMHEQSRSEMAGFFVAVTRAWVIHVHGGTVLPMMQPACLRNHGLLPTKDVTRGLWMSGSCQEGSLDLNGFGLVS